MVRLFERRSISFYLGLAAGALGIATAILYAVYSRAVNHYVPLMFAVLLLAGLSCTGMVLTKLKFACLVPAVLFAAAFGLYVNDRLIMFEEMINKIYGMTESGAILGIVLTIFALILAAFIAVTISAFMDEPKRQVK